jgi:hypothetical protein
MSKSEEIADRISRACSYVLQYRSDGMQNSRRVICTEEEKEHLKKASREFGVKIETLNNILFNREQA